jgi:hypothetical protein
MWRIPADDEDGVPAVALLLTPDLRRILAERQGEPAEE